MNNKRVFLAAPISGFPDEEEYNEYRKCILQLILYLRQESFDVYSEVEKIADPNTYDLPGESANKDFHAIDDVDCFLLLHPRKFQSSTLIELGYAFAKGKAIVIVSQRKNLPYLALGLASISDRVIVVDSAELDESLVMNAIKSIMTLQSS